MNYFLKQILEKIRIGHVIFIWLAINIASASFTLLYSDESYYALFANRLDFGYFDHPPMIALMIRIGSFIFKNEIGIRILSVIGFSIALFFTYRLADVDNPVLFMAAIFSILGLNILGSLALPDSPLLLFSSLFFLAYRRYLQKESIVNSIFLGLTVAALLYSKYHGILVLIFTFGSNIKLIKSGKFWLSVFLGFILFLPHIIWQINNEFVSVFYHLSERSASQYKVSFTFEYLTGQILYYGPVSMFFMVIATFSYKRTGLLERAFIWNILGIMGFFLLSSFKGRVEVNWTLPIMIPLLIFLLKFSVENPVFTRWFYLSAVPIIIIICLLRVEIAYPVFDFKINRINDLRGHKEFVKEISEKSQGLPVIANSYQKAGIISFYSGTFIPSINLNGRRNQFNIWHSDDSLRFKKVAFVNNYLDKGINIQNQFYKYYRVTIIDSLPVMNDININIPFSRLIVKKAETVNINVYLSSAGTPEQYRDAGDFTTRLSASLYCKDSILIVEECMQPVNQLLKMNNGEYNFHFKAPQENGRYKIIVALKTSVLGTWSTKKSIDLIVR